MATIQKKTPRILTAVDYDILKLVYEYHFLTVSQVTRVRYSSGSETTCQDRLKRLSDLGFLHRRKLPHVDSGNTEYLYYLSTLGQKELLPFGISHFSRVRKSDIEDMKLPHLEHVKSLNDFLIAARLLCRANCDISLVTMLHDLDMKRTPMRVTVDRQLVSIVPDGFLDFRLSVAGRLYAMPVWIEIDRGTTWGRTLQQKLQKIITAIQSLAFADLFGVSSVTVAIATTDNKRVDLMRLFIQAELERLGLTHLAHVFLVTSRPDGLLNPQEIFLSPIWYTPGTSSPLALLDLSE